MVSGNNLDFIFIGLFVALLLVGLRIGLINMVAAVLVVTTSYFSITGFGDSLADLVQDSWDISINLIRAIVYIAIILVAVAVFAVLARLLRSILSYAWLSWVDLLGGATVAIVVSLFTFSLVSSVGAWAFSVGGLAADALGPLAPDVLTRSVGWIDAQLSGSFVANSLALPLWNIFSFLLPSDFLGVGTAEVTTAVEDYLAGDN